ncbi:V-type ATP synthase subunit I [Candidatus Woesearchaeota archaeon]|nr:V-type ATP synthase subunit I [Candidatus Woesearchaeota archaeon]
MIMPQRMTKARIIVPKTQLERAVKELHSSRVLHIHEHEKAELDIGEPFENAEKLSELLVLIRSLQSHLRTEHNLKTGHGQPDITYVEKSIRKLHNEVTDKNEKLKKLEEDLKRMTQLQADLQCIAKIGLPLESYSGYQNLSCITGTCKSMDKAKRELHRETDKFRIFEPEDKSAFALFINKENRQKAFEILSNNGFTEIPTESFSGMKGSPEIHAQRIVKEIRLAEGEREKTKQELKKLKHNWQQSLASFEKSISQELEIAQAPLKFGSTRNIAVITGWVPTSSMISLKKRLEKAASGKIYIREEEFDEEEAPVKLHNIKPARPFEFLMHLRGLPVYNEIDPTIILFLTFPIFFGFMLGDIGYGMVTLALSLLIRAKMEKAKNLATILALASASSILFGFVFGEFFGEENLLGMELPRLMSRAHEEGIQQLLVASLILGAVHINIGLLAGFYNELKHHGLKQAILEKFSWFLIEAGGPFILASLGIIKIMQPYLTISLSLLIAGVVMLAIGEMRTGTIGAFKAIVESITIFSNILSYARLMAVGLASVQLAIIINEFAKESFHQGGFSVVIGIIILLLGHVLNIVLGLLGSFLHSLRLEYVEFFTKFFIGGAKPYKPFGENTTR